MMRVTWRAALGIGGVVCALATARAGEAPGFSGKWRLEPSVSDFGKGHAAPLGRTDEIRVEGPWVQVASLTVRPDGDTLRLDYRYRSDGAATNRVRGQEVRTRGRRDGAALRFDSEAWLGPVKVTVAEQWRLSGAGDTLTFDRNSNSIFGKERQRLVFVRAR